MHRRFLIPVVLFLILISWPLAAMAQDLSSPRALFHTYLTAMQEVKQGDEKAIQTAVACLDLPGDLKAARGPNLARDLKEYLDKTVYVRTDQIPGEEYDADEYVYLRLPGKGAIKTVRKEDGNWLFSWSTMEALPALLKTVERKEYIDGIEGGGGAGTRDFNFADWLRPMLPDAFKESFFLLQGWQWLSILVIAFLGFILDRIVRFILTTWMSRLLKKAGRKVDRVLEVNFAPPVGILVMAWFWSMMLRPLSLPLGAHNTLLIATEVVMAIAGVWAAYRLVDLVASYLASLAQKTESTLDDLLVPLIRRSLKIIVIAFGIVFVAKNRGIDVSSLLAGLGIGGLAFALAAKDTVENLFGSLTVVIDRPFKIGDWIKIGDLEGTVEELGLRSTRIRTFYNSQITIPNSSLVNTSVDNLGERTYRRVKCMISIQYDTPAEKIEAFCEGIRELIRQHPYTRKDYYNVYFNEFADSGLNILLYAFHEVPDWTTELRERHRLFVDIVRLAQKLGVEFAFPTRTLHIASMPTAGEQPEPAPASGWSGAGHDDAVKLGREEAKKIAATMWGDKAQPAVTFDDPDKISPMS